MKVTRKDLWSAFLFRFLLKSDPRLKNTLQFWGYLWPILQQRFYSFPKRSKSPVPIAYHWPSVLRSDLLFFWWGLRIHSFCPCTTCLSRHLHWNRSSFPLHGEGCPSTCHHNGRHCCRTCFLCFVSNHFPSHLCTPSSTCFWNQQPNTFPAHAFCSSTTLLRICRHWHSIESQSRPSGCLVNRRPIYESYSIYWVFISRLHCEAVSTLTRSLLLS